MPDQLPNVQAVQVNTEIEKLEDQINVIRSEMTRYADGGRESDRTKSTALRDVSRVFGVDHGWPSQVLTIGLNLRCHQQ